MKRTLIISAMASLLMLGSLPATASGPHVSVTASFPGVVLTLGQQGGYFVENIAPTRHVVHHYVPAPRYYYGHRPHHHHGPRHVYKAHKHHDKHYKKHHKHHKKEYKHHHRQHKANRHHR